MFLKLTALLLVFTGLSFLVLSCDLLENENDEDGDMGTILMLSEEPQNTIHDDFLLVSEAIPDFAGFFFDEDGNPNVGLKNPDPDRVSEIRGVLENVFGSDILSRGDNPRRPVPAPVLVLRKADFTFTELFLWFQMLDIVFEVESVVSTEIDEERNRIVIGVTDQSAFGQLSEILSEIDISDDAIIIELEERDALRTLRAQFRPVMGGIQIRRSGGGICTLGLRVSYQGVMGFVTNSHCTASFGRVTGSTFGNPDGARQIGVEMTDPALTSCGFLNRLRCRRSDAAFIRLNNGIASRSQIARTRAWAGPGEGLATLELDTSRPTLAVNQEKLYPFRGEMIDKIGRTTGWTYGVVQKTCANRRLEDVQYDGRTIRLDCQMTSNLFSDEGDSGSPIFLWRQNEAIITGLLWGGSDNHTSFSPWGQLLQ